MSFVMSIQNSVLQITRMILYDNLKTGDPIKDSLITTLFIGLISWLISKILNNDFNKIKDIIYFFDDFKSLICKINSIELEGRYSSNLNNGKILSLTHSFSDRFNALWFHIISNIENNKHIYKLKEFHATQISEYNDHFNYKLYEKDVLMVSQNKHFMLDDDIFVKTTVQMDGLNETDSYSKETVSVKISIIKITIYSYKYSIHHLKKYVDKLRDDYLNSIKDERVNNKYIYFLCKNNFTERELIYNCWRETMFESSRTFDNIFFDGKKQILNNIDYFLNNRKWYEDKGIPYSLGIGLHGPPGTGKTSFIKALANYTNRHIIVMSLKMIKTKPTDREAN